MGYDITELPNTLLHRRDWFNEFELIGYHVPLATAEDPIWSTLSEPKVWWRIQEILQLAKTGDFSNGAELYSISKQYTDDDFGGDTVAVTFLGDFADSQTLQRISKEAELLCADESIAEAIYDLREYYFRILTQAGRLADARLLLKAYPHYSHRDFDSSWLSLSDFLEHQWREVLEEQPVDNFEKFHRDTTAVINSVAERVGGEHVRVFLGERFSVRRLAKLIIQHNDIRDHFNESIQPDLRRRFEASTGIDCTSFFTPKGRFQPLTACAIAEDFLESDYSKTFVDGERYFFGHRIP